MDIDAAEAADNGPVVPEPGTELGVLDDARLAELTGRPRLAVDNFLTTGADGGHVPEPGTELGALDDARLAELTRRSGPADSLWLTPLVALARGGTVILAEN